MVRQSINVWWRSNRKCGVSPVYILLCGSQFSCTVCTVMHHKNNHMPVLAHETDTAASLEFERTTYCLQVYFSLVPLQEIKPGTREKRGESITVWPCWLKFRWSTSSRIKTKWFGVYLINLSSVHLQIRHPCLPPLPFLFIFSPCHLKGKELHWQANQNTPLDWGPIWICAMCIVA